MHLNSPKKDPIWGFCKGTTYKSCIETFLVFHI